MIIYVESNFILELVRAQKDYPHIENILKLAENSKDKIELLTPFFAICESLKNLELVESGRIKIREELEAQINQYKRSNPSEESIKPMRDTVSRFMEIKRLEIDYISETVKRVLNIGIIELNSEIITLLKKPNNDLKIGDFIVYSSIVSDLKQRDLDKEKKQEPKIFLSRDEDFDELFIRQELSSYNCALCKNFEYGFLIIDNYLNPQKYQNKSLWFEIFSRLLRAEAESEINKVL